MAKTSAQKSADYRAKNVEAYREKKREYAKTPEQREKRTEYMRGYREKNRERMNKQAAESQTRHRHRHVDKVRNLHYKYKYGITLADYDRMESEQGGKCKICSTTEPKGMGRWHVDHCHSTGKVRGLLCNNCNTKLGWYERLSDEIAAYLHEEK